MSEEHEIVDETLDEGRNLGGEDDKPSMSPEKKRKIIMIVLSSVTAVSVLGGGGAMFILLTKGAGDGQVREIDTSALRKPGPEDLPIYHEFPEQMVDIKSKGRRTRYVRIRMVAEVYFPENHSKLLEVEPKILDGIQSYLRAHTAKELSGRKGTEAMRDAFMQVARQAMGRENKIETLLFKEILVQ